MNKGINEVTAILAKMQDGGQVSGHEYQRDPRANVDLAEVTLADDGVPYALFMAVTDWEIDTRHRRRREVVRVLVQFVSKETQLAPVDYQEQQTSGLSKCQSAAEQLLACLFDSVSFEIVQDTVQAKTVFDEYDTNVIGVAVTMTIRERQGECLPPSLDYDEHEGDEEDTDE